MNIPIEKLHPATLASLIADLGSHADFSTGDLFALNMQLRAAVGDMQAFEMIEAMLDSAESEAAQ